MRAPLDPVSDGGEEEDDERRRRQKGIMESEE
jgi:hypothetical protein